MGSAIERDVSKFLITVLYAAIIADVLTHGQVAIKIGQIIQSVILSGFSIAAGKGVVR